MHHIVVAVVFWFWRRASCMRVTTTSYGDQSHWWLSMLIYLFFAFSLQFSFSLTGFIASACHYKLLPFVVESGSPLAFTAETKRFVNRDIPMVLLQCLHTGTTKADYIHIFVFKNREP